MSFYGRTREGGGFALVLTSYMSDEAKESTGSEDTIEIKFNFSRGENIVASVEFSYGLDSGCWFVVHSTTEFLPRGMEDPAADLADLLGIERNNRGVDHVHEDHALDRIALAADYTFANCDEPDIGVAS